MLYEPTLLVTHWLEPYVDYLLNEFHLWLVAPTCRCGSLMRWEIIRQLHQCYACGGVRVYGVWYASGAEYVDRKQYYVVAAPPALGADSRMQQAMEEE